MKTIDVQDVNGNSLWYWRIRQAMGINQAKLPDGGTDWKPIAIRVNGVETITNARLLSREEVQNWKPNVNRPHRLMIQCPTCGDIKPAGRLGQHMEAHR